MATNNLGKHVENLKIIGEVLCGLVTIKSIRKIIIDLRYNGLGKMFTNIMELA